MKQVVFSRAIQYGVGNIEEMWLDALDYPWISIHVLR